MSGDQLLQVGTMTVLLDKARNGDRGALDAVFKRAYPEMRAKARQFLNKYGRQFPEGATAMVNLVCEKLLARENLAANDRRHFFNLFGRLMHDALIDEIRAKNAEKRGGKLQRREANDQLCASGGATIDLIDLKNAIEALWQHDPEAAEAINLKFFCGQTLEQVAETMSCTFATARQHLDYGRAWLRAKLSK